jgi:hypothetical protein
MKRRIQMERGDKVAQISFGRWCQERKAAYLEKAHA